MNLQDILRKLRLLRHGAQAGGPTAPVSSGTSDLADAQQSAAGHEDPTEVVTAIRRPGVAHYALFWIPLVLAALLTMFTFGVGGITWWGTATLAIWAAYLYLAKGFALERRYHIGVIAGVLATAVVGSTVFFLLAMPGTPARQTADARVMLGLTFDDAHLATPGTDGTLQPVNDGIFKRGAEVDLVLLNVRGFKRGTDGKYWFDINVTLSDSSDNILSVKHDILGDSGHQALENGIAKSPFASVATADLAPGKYKLKLTIYDKIGGGRASITKQFTVK